MKVPDGHSVLVCSNCEVEACIACEADSIWKIFKYTTLCMTCFTSNQFVSEKEFLFNIESALGGIPRNCKTHYLYVKLMRDHKSLTKTELELLLKSSLTHINDLKYNEGS